MLKEIHAERVVEVIHGKKGKTVLCSPWEDHEEVIRGTTLRKVENRK